jgi:phosphatidate cytidylyltransferase
VIKRIASSVILWAVVLGALWRFRADGAVALAALLAAATLLECYRLLGAAGWAPFAKLGTFFGTLITVAPWLHARFGWRADVLPALAAIVFSVRVLGERPAEKRIEALASTLFGLVYVGLLLQFLVRIATPLPGDGFPPDARLFLCVWVVAVAKFCDVGALLAGLAFGRHPLAPRISPKKTWEGVAGGLVLAMAVGGLGAALVGSRLLPGLTPLRAALLAAPIAGAGVVSDLVESALKRRAAIKDSGGVIPGIGGIFDLSDSLILAAPVGYFLLGLR